MPVVTCPNCPTKLKVPDGAKGNVKCPKCGTVFPAAAAPAPAASGFEVVDDAPPKPAAGSKAAAPLPKAGTKPAKAVATEVEDDFEVVDEKPKKKTVAAEAADDDDDDDEPKKKKKKDDEDEAKAKKKKKAREEDDAPEEVQPGDRAGFGCAETGAKLIGLSLWLYVATYIYLALLLALAWAGVAVPNILMAVAGLLGLANWTLGLIGCANCLAGPPRARGRAATALAVALVHLLLTFGGGNRGMAQSAIPLLSSKAKAESVEADAKRLMEKLMKETDPAKKKDIEKEMRELGGGFDEDRPGRGGVSAGDPFWQQLATQNLVADQFLANLFYESKTFTRYLAGFLSGLFEVLRVVFLIGLLGAVGRAARDSGVANKSLMSTLSVLGVTLLSMIIMLIIALILDDSKGSSKTPPAAPADPLAAAKKAVNTLAGGELFVYLLHAGGLVLAAVMALGASSAAGRRA